MLSSFLFVNPSNIWSRVETNWKYCLKHWFMYKFKNFELCWRGMRQLSNWVDLQFCLILAFICADTIVTELVSSLRLVWSRFDQTFLKSLCFLFCEKHCCNWIINSLYQTSDTPPYLYSVVYESKRFKKSNFFLCPFKTYLFCRLASCWTVLSLSSLSVLT